MGHGASAAPPGLALPLRPMFDKCQPLLQMAMLVGTLLSTLGLLCVRAVERAGGRIPAPAAAPHTSRATFTLPLRELASATPMAAPRHAVSLLRGLARATPPRVADGTAVAVMELGGAFANESPMPPKSLIGLLAARDGVN